MVYHLDELLAFHLVLNLKFLSFNRVNFALNCVLTVRNSPGRKKKDIIRLEEFNLHKFNSCICIEIFFFILLLLLLLSSLLW